MTTQLVIFDCDGVLVESETITTDTIIEAVARSGLRWDRARVLDRHRGGNLARVRADAEAELGRPLPEDFIPRFRERLYERLRADVEPIPGIEAALDAIPYPVCVASNGPRAKMETTLGATGLLARFEGRLYSACSSPTPGSSCTPHAPWV
jgi:beta-phosphoglucomutase-like phosphatase (HAD superfamily)